METNQIRDNPKVSKNVLFMGLVGFFNDLSSEIVYPLIPIFLTTILGAPVTVMGIIEGIAESAGSVFKVIFGWISDRLQKRKSIVILGYLFSAFSKLLLGLSYVWPLVLGARFVDRLGKGIRTSARDALIVESTVVNRRGLSFGFHSALDTMGAVIGPLLAIVLIKIFHDNFHFIFYLAAIPGFIGVLLLVSLVKEKPKNPLPFSSSLLKLNDFNFPFKFFVLISCIFAIGKSSDAQANNLIGKDCAGSKINGVQCFVGGGASYDDSHPNQYKEYWSSSEHLGTDKYIGVWIQDFSNGLQFYHFIKIESYSGVRAIRAFNDSTIQNDDSHPSSSSSPPKTRSATSHCIIQ